MKRWRLPLLLALLLAFFFACFTWEYTERDSGYSREARLNPWLAAGRLLEQNGMQVHFAPEYARLPPRARVIVLATPLQYLDEREQRALLDWIGKGGHLVMELPESGARADDRDLVLQQLDVGLRKRDFSEAERKTLAREPPLRALRLGDEGLVQAHFRAHYHLAPGKRAPRWTATDKYGAHVMRFAQGSGRVTVLSDSGWLHNASLAEGDHAALLWRVVDARPGDAVWLIHGVERPSLFALLRELAAPFLAALALCVLVWLWAISRRFGPLESVLPAARRRLSEHLEASGRYLLRHGGLGLLYDASRQRLLAQLQRRHPQWKRLPSAALATQLAARARLEPAAILRLLESDAPDHLLQFTADIRLINRLRKAL
ncbi:MAG: DUF4350 domain-containing protein [Pseudomonadota bacterium]